jgi:hypothetical protein
MLRMGASSRRKKGSEGRALAVFKLKEREGKGGGGAEREGSGGHGRLSASWTRDHAGGGGSGTRDGAWPWLVGGYWAVVSRMSWAPPEKQMIVFFISFENEAKS